MHSWSLAFRDFITWIAHIAMFKNALSQTFIKGGRLLVFHGYRNTWWMNLIPCECVCVYHRLCCFLHNVEHLFSTASESSVNQTTRSKGLTPCESGFGVVFLRYGILTIVSILSLILAWRIKMHVHWSQGRRKQSADGQTQFDVNDEIGNNSRALRAAKFLT